MVRIKRTYDDNIRIIAIDPGSNCCGMSILELNPETLEVEIVRSETVNAKDVIGHYKHLEELLGARLCRNLGYMDYLSFLLKKWRIDYVVVEGAYAGRFIKAFEALTEQLSCFKIAVRNFDKRMTFLMLEASAIKKNMGVKGNSGDKTLMHKALLADKSFTYCDSLDIHNLDEHAVDSCCVGLYALKLLLEELKPLTNYK